jgi:hypothetical protein
VGLAVVVGGGIEVVRVVGVVGVVGVVEVVGVTETVGVVVGVEVGGTEVCVVGWLLETGGVTVPVLEGVLVGVVVWGSDDVGTGEVDVDDKGGIVVGVVAGAEPPQLYKVSASANAKQAENIFLRLPI